MSQQRVLVIRTCNKELQAHGGFQWPAAGFIEAPDWDPNPALDCGQGLHGLAWGVGDWSMMSNAPDAKWLVVAVDPSDGIVYGATACRFRRGEVVYCGDWHGAAMRMFCSEEAMDRARYDASVHLAEGNYSSSAKSGMAAYSSARGSYATAASSGECALAAANGHAAAASSGGRAAVAATSGYATMAAAAGYGTIAAASAPATLAATSGNSSSAATTGAHSRAVACGDFASAAAIGQNTVAVAAGEKTRAEAQAIAVAVGNGGQAQAGPDGLLIVTYWDSDAKRYRACVGEVGVDGIEAHVPYKVQDGKLVPC